MKHRTEVEKSKGAVWIAINEKKKGKKACHIA